jgi:DNA-binding MarR family transcriptional regulator
MIEFLDLPEAGAIPDSNELAGPDDEQAARLMRNGAVLGSVWRTMRRSKPAIIARSVDGRFEPRLETGDVDTLELIAAVGGTAQTSQIATALDVASSTASQAVSRLVDRGLVARTQDVDDRRVFRLALTEPGQQAFEIVRAGRLRFARQVIAEFSPQDQAALHRVLPLLAEGVKREFVREPAAVS